MRLPLPDAPSASLTSARSYVEYVALTYAKSGVLSLMGPPLGPESSGPLIARTVEQLTYGWRDPVVAASSPPLSADSPWWAYDPALTFSSRRSSEMPLWLDLAESVRNGTAPAGAAARFLSITIQTQDGVSQMGNVLDDMHSSSVVAAGGNVSVAGRLTGRWGWGNLAKAPFALDEQESIDWYWPRAGLVPEPEAPIGLGRVVRLSWDGEPAQQSSNRLMSQRYELLPQDMQSCSSLSAGNATTTDFAGMRCLYGEEVDGVWNLSFTAKAPLLVSRGHLYGADPAIAASLGSGAAAMRPNLAEHNIMAVVDVAAGIALQVHYSVQTNVGLKPTPLLSPLIWHGQPGPGGYTFLPSGWTNLTLVSLPTLDITIFALQVGLRNTPRITAGTLNLAGSLAAAITFYFLYTSKRNEAAAASADTKEAEAEVGQ